VTVVKQKVLVLDEDLLALELYSRELEADYQVITSVSVDETRRILKANLLDALVMEPAVNEGEGWNLLGEIQVIPNPPLVILCSVEDERKCGFEKGALAFVLKPALPTEIHSLLDHILAKRSNHNTQRMEKGT
jgi:DNA-binding response OmpR family regulator